MPAPTTDPANPPGKVDAARENARKLVGKMGDPEAEAEIGRLLSMSPDSPEFIAVVDELGTAPWVNVEFLPELISACKSSPASQKPALFRAVASIRERAAAEYLVSLLDIPSVDAPLRRAAMDALARQTGREDLGDDPAKWQAFLAATPDEEAWHIATLRAVASGLERERTQRASVQSRLLETLRALHLATPSDKRWPLISSMVGDALPCVNLLGLELVSRELSAGNRPDAKVGVQILTLLNSPDPSIREQAAILVANLAPEGAEDAIRAALGRERVPATAAALLNAAARWPNAKSEQSVLHWVDPAIWTSTGSTVRDASLDAAWALYRAGMLRSGAASQRVLAAVRTIPLANLSGAGCRLRAELGDRTDLEAMVVLLGSKNQAQRLAAAESLVTAPEFLPRILAAAREDPLLIEIAVRGVLTMAPTITNFAAIEEATRGVPDQRRAALTTIAAALNEDEILEASRRLRADPALRESVLATLADARRVMAERTDPPRLSYTAEALVELAELRIELGKFGEAIAALDALPEIQQLVPADRLRDLRAIALIGGNRLDQARLLGAKADVWLRALELIDDQPQAAQVASFIETGMADSLSDADRARLEKLKAKIVSKAP
ncbi:MAG: hypothetical protein KF805_14490 [Phycisphaeraceae bacterium]|nr:hypothetical protein [Phycisphaeraceae bacterium]